MRPWPWIAWLAAFLILELPAAMSQRVRRHWITLSETVPRWFPTKARFCLLAQFLLVLIWHLYGMVAMSLGEPGHWSWSAQVIGLSGLPVVASIIWAEIRRPKVGIKDKAARWLALRWLRGKLKEDGSMLSKIRKALEGWKLVIAVLATFVVAVYDQQSNGHAGDMLGAILAVLGWQIAPDLALDLKHAVPAFLGIIGIAGRVWRAVKQARVGASPSELLSTEGYIKAAVAKDGVTKTLASAGVSKG